MKNLKILKNSLLVLSSVLLLTQNGYTAQDGTLGATSSGSKDISVTVAKMTRITGLEDYTVNWKVGDGNLEDSDNVCIYSNTGSDYKITASSSNGSGDFILKSGSTELDYQVSWTDSSGASFDDGDGLSEDDQSSTFNNASTTSSNCSGGNNATVSIKVLASDLEAVDGTSTAFEDTLTLAVAPI